jgi:hypothetical protein
MDKKIYRGRGFLIVSIGVLLAWAPGVLPARVEPVEATSKPETLPALQGQQAIRRLKELGLYDSLQKAVELVGYEMRQEEPPAKGGGAPTYHAPNPAQQLDAYFSPDGLNLAPSKAATSEVESAGGLAVATPQAEAPAWVVKMRLTGYGYSEAWINAGFAEVEANGNQIDYRRTPGIREWYVNSKKGLEQGFTVEAAPGGRRDGEWLRLALALAGDLRAEAVEEGRAITFKQEDGEPVLRYSDLYAYDATGRELPTQMKVNDGQVYLEVDERDATYPLTIDPIFSQQQILEPSAGGDGDFFGNAVAISGNIAVVGAPYDDIKPNVDQGSAYVFVRSPNGAGWIFDQKLTADSGAAGDKFGFSVAISIETVVTEHDACRFPRCFPPHGPYTSTATYENIVIGVPDDDIDSMTNRGSAVSFWRDIWGDWRQLQQLIAPDGDSWDRFGSSVAAIGNRIVIGSPDDKIDDQNEGSAHVFNRSNLVWWDWNQKLTANSASSTARFGHAVAIHGDTVVVGAPGYNSAFIFGYGFAVWSQQQRLKASAGSFGDSVAINGNTLVVGAPSESVQNPNQGAAYLFVRSSTGSWDVQQRLVAADGMAGDGFGHSVSIRGNTVAVGAPGDDIGANSDQGSVYIFAPSSMLSWTQQWTQQQKLTIAGSAKPDAFFGRAVALAASDLTVLVGVPGEGRFLENGFYRTGSAHVFVSP